MRAARNFLDYAFFASRISFSLLTPRERAENMENQPQPTTSQEPEEPVYAELKTVVLEEVISEQEDLQAGTSGAIDEHFGMF